MSSFQKLQAIVLKPAVIVSSIVLIALVFLYIDKPLAEYLNQLDLATHFHYLSWFTKLGLSLAYMVFFVILALYFRYIRRNRLWEERFWFLWLCVVIPGCICVALKVMLGRARPSLWFDEHYFGFYGFHTQATYWSFPSGHTTTIIGLALALSIIFPRYFYALLGAGILVAISRVLLVQHYFSDVLSAGYLTILEIALMVWVLQKKSWLKRVVDCAS